MSVREIAREVEVPYNTAREWLRGTPGHSVRTRADLIDDARRWRKIAGTFAGLLQQDSHGAMSLRDLAAHVPVSHVAVSKAIKEASE